jgi:hypothetical protein
VPVRSKLPCLSVVGEIGVEVRHQARFEAFVANREHHLDAAEEVSIHPVRARTEDLLIAAVVEVVDAAVLEEPADDRAHPHVLGDAGDARSQTADAAHDEIHVDARGRGFVQRPDHLGLHERV